MIGPVNTIKSQSKYFVRIVPGSVKATDLAKQIRAQLRKQIPQEEIPVFNQLSLDDIIRIIPPSGGDLPQETK